MIRFEFSGALLGSGEPEQVGVSVTSGLSTSPVFSLEPASPTTYANKGV